MTLKWLLKTDREILLSNEEINENILNLKTIHNILLQEESIYSNKIINSLPFKIGFEFEFYPKKKYKKQEELITAIKRYLSPGKLIIQLDKSTKFNPTAWTLTRDLSLRDGGVELITPIILKNSEAMSELKNVLQMINEIGITDETTSLHIHTELSTLNELNPLKLIMFINDESRLRQWTKNDKNYSKDIYKFLQSTKIEQLEFFHNIINRNFSVNFDYIETSNHLEFRSIDGIDYQKNFSNIQQSILTFLKVYYLASTDLENDRFKILLHELYSSIIEEKEIMQLSKVIEQYSIFKVSDFNTFV